MSVCRVHRAKSGGLKWRTKKDERTENTGLNMEDQMSWVENTGAENAGTNGRGGKCRT